MQEPLQLKAQMGEDAMAQVAVLIVTMRREVKFKEAQMNSTTWLPFLLATGWTTPSSAGNKECHWWRSCCSSHGGDLQMEGISAGQEDGDGKSADVSRFPHFCRKMQDPAQPFWHLPSYLFRVVQMPAYHQSDV